MAVNYNFKKGTDLPAWHFISGFPPGSSNHGTSSVYDGTRYIYWVVQYGSTSTSASTTQLWRFDTWTDGWQYLATPTSGNRGMDIELDKVRNVLYIVHGAGLTSWQVFNLNTTAVTIANVSCAAWALTTITVVLPAAADYGAALVLPNYTDIPDTIENGVAGSGGTTTNLVANTDLFTPGMVGLQVNVTSGTQINKVATIQSVTNSTTAVIAPAFAGGLSANDTFTVKLPQATATAGAAGTITDGNASWVTNVYTNCDVWITAGTGAGQHRRIASNNGTVLTLAGAVTGNADTGNWTTPPDNTSVYIIKPSHDFVYYQPGSTSTAFYRLDVSQTTGAAWSASLGAITGQPSGGGNILHDPCCAPFFLFSMRGNATGNFYWFNIGTTTWSTPTVWLGSETFTTGAASSIIRGKKKVFIAKDSSQRCYILNQMTGVLEPAGFAPYAAPGAYCGKRVKYVKTADGVDMMYYLRAGGQEFYRVPLEWL